LALTQYRWLGAVTTWRGRAGAAALAGRSISTPSAREEEQERLVWADNETDVDLLGFDFLVDALVVALTEPGCCR
jgi:hypothetical protein